LTNWLTITASPTIDTFMNFPNQILELINTRAATLGVDPPRSGDDLFSTGILDSFALLDLVMLVESECGIRIPDRDVVATNFRSMDMIENYVSRHMPQ
jgi:acyl carrier protein